MTIAAISAISFVLGATVAYVASRYPGHREVIDAVGAVFLIGWALLSSLVINTVSADAVDANATAPEPQV
jgi:hypothetical protein